MSSEKIVILGTGYVGFPLAVILARSGFKVVGVDIRREVVRGINSGDLPIREKEIEAIFKEPAVRTNLVASEVVDDGDVYVISVPTPLERRRKVADLSAVIAATESIASHLKRGNLVILESTVPALTCRELITPIIEKRTGLKVNEDVGLVHCPERILPGNVFEEIVKNDRVIGSLSELARERAKSIYETFVKGKIFLTDDVTAEPLLPVPGPRLLSIDVHRDVDADLADLRQRDPQRRAVAHSGAGVEGLHEAAGPVLYARQTRRPLPASRAASQPRTPNSPWLMSPTWVFHSSFPVSASSATV